MIYRSAKYETNTNTTTNKPKCPFFRRLQVIPDGVGWGEICIFVFFLVCSLSEGPVLRYNLGLPLVLSKNSYFSGSSFLASVLNCDLLFFYRRR